MSDLDTLERARGRWLQILPHFGIDSSFLKKKHGPCPLCGGRDRFRFDDKEGSGSYYCHQCGAGAGIILIRKKNGWDFKTAADAIDKIIGNDAKPMQIEKPKADNGSKARAIERLLAEATDSDVVSTYLAKRGLRVSSSVLKGHSRCDFFDEDHRFIARYPAVVAPIVADDGTIESAHRIYDAESLPKKERKKFLPAVRTITGAAVRLHDMHGDELGVGEGIETCLAAHELFGLPVWAALNANGVKNFVIPKGTKRLMVLGDNDADSEFDGQASAYSLAKRAAHSGIKVTVKIPETPGADWLDVLNGAAE